MSTSFGCGIGAAVIAALLISCATNAPPEKIQACASCEQLCALPDGCPRNHVCARCAGCASRGYACANCGKRARLGAPCARAPACHVTCKGCQWENKDACTRDLCACPR